MDILPREGQIIKECTEYKALYRSLVVSYLLCPDCLNKAKTRIYVICKEDFQVKTIDSMQKIFVCPIYRKSAPG